MHHIFSSRYVEAEPSWAKQLEGEMTLGRKRVTFRFLVLLHLHTLFLLLIIIMEGKRTSGSSKSSSSSLPNHLACPCQPSSSSKHTIVPLTPTTNNDLHSIILTMSRASSPVTNQSATCSFTIHIKVAKEWKTTQSPL